MLLSIVIPTHNRQKYAKGCVDSLSKIASEEVEILVSDSSSANDLFEYVKSNYSSINIKVLKPENVNNAVENFNYAIDKAQGHYILIIGDDDTVLPNIVNLLKYLQEKSVDAVRFNFPYEYFWDDCYEEHKNLNNSMRATSFTGEVTEFDALTEAMEAGNNFGHGVLKMPRAYLGVVSRPLIDRIENKYGKLFGGVSPDIYSSLLISYESAKTVNVDFPVVIPGSSGASTSGKSVNGKHVSELMDNDHLSAFPNLKWDLKIPKFYSTHTVWAFSYLQALSSIKNHDNFMFEPDFYRLYIKTLYTYKAYSKYTFKSLRLSLSRNYTIETGKLIGAVIKEVAWVINRGFYRIIKTSKLHNIENINSLSLCQKKIESEINRIKIFIKFKV